MGLGKTKSPEGWVSKSMTCADNDGQLREVWLRQPETSRRHETPARCTLPLWATIPPQPAARSISSPHLLYLIACAFINLELPWVPRYPSCPPLRPPCDEIQTDGFCSKGARSKDGLGASTAPNTSAIAKYWLVWQYGRQNGAWYRVLGAEFRVSQQLRGLTSFHGLSLLSIPDPDFGLNRFLVYALYNTPL
jgi:hypothetical protein